MYTDNLASHIMQGHEKYHQTKYYVSANNYTKNNYNSTIKFRK